MSAATPLRALRQLALSCAVLAAPLALSACSDDEPPPVQPLAGSKAGTVRYVVHLKGEPPDASAYRAALKEDPAKAAKLAEELKMAAALNRKKLVQALKAYDGRVVDHWFLTNAVTVEIPAGNALSLTAIDGVAKVEPDQLLVE
jgi:hypothetical protein